MTSLDPRDYMVLGFFEHFLQNCWWFFVNFMLFKLCLLFKNGQWKFLFWQKNWGHFLPFFVPEFGHFCYKNQVFGHFLWNRTSDLSKTWSESGDNCFESSNDSVVSGKILVLAVLAIFESKIHCLWWHYMVLVNFWPFSSKPLMFFC